MLSNFYKSKAPSSLKPKKRRLTLSNERIGNIVLYKRHEGIVIKKPLILSSMVVSLPTPSLSLNSFNFHIVKIVGTSAINVSVSLKGIEVLTLSYLDHVIQHLPTLLKQRSLKNLFEENDPLIVASRYMLEV